MAIVFHCEYCGKKIKAADTAGGKWGKCPACHKKLYVPSLDTREELKLAPVNESNQERERQLMSETYRLTQDILINTSRTNVVKRGNPWAMGAFISAVSPNLIAFAYVLWHHVLQPGQKSDMDFFSGSPLVILPLLGSLFLGFLLPSFWTMLLGIISIVLAIVATRKSQMGGKGLAGVA